MKLALTVCSAAVASALALGACATNPATGEREISLLSESQEIAMGQQMDPEIRREMGVYDDPELQAYVQQVGSRLAAVSDRPDLPWHFTVVDVPVVNAFALPGGYIYLTRGIMAFLDDEAEMAGVLGHEIAHVTARHASQSYTRSTAANLGLLLGSIFVPEARPYAGLAQTGLGMLFLKYSRDDELQADSLGARYAAEGGWHPEGVSDMLRTLGRLDQVNSPGGGGVPGWLASHPDPGDRVDEVTGLVAELQQQYPDRAVDRVDYLRHVDGLLYGPDPDEGIVVDGRFIHPQLRFAVDFPEGWQIVNGRTQVVAQAPDQSGAVILQVADLPASDLGRGAVQWMAQQGFQQLRGQSTRVNGLSAHVGTYVGQMEQAGTVGVRALHVALGDQVFVVAGLAPEARFSAFDTAFNRALGSFQPISAAEASRIEPNRVQIYEARRGDTWERLAARAARDSVTAATLAALNGQSVEQPPPAGEPIKIVVAD